MPADTTQLTATQLFDLWFSRAGTLASLIGLVISFVIVNSIKSERIRVKRVPVLIEDVSASATRINELQPGFPGNIAEVQATLSDLHGHLSSLAPKLRGQDKSSARQIVQKINVIHLDQPDSPDNLRKLYSELLKLLSKLRHNVEDENA